MVPLGDFHIFLRLNSFTRASSGVMVAHLTPTPSFLIALAASMVTWSSVSSRFSIAEVVIEQVDVEIGMDQLVLDQLPDDAGHLVAVDLDDGVGHLDLRHCGVNLVKLCEREGRLAGGAAYSIREPGGESAPFSCFAGRLAAAIPARAEVTMPGAGTDKTKRWLETPAPIVVLVEPQLGENIGAAARAMANFGLSRLRLVKPLQGWPNEKARVMAAGADRVLDGAALYDSLEAAIADCTFVLATTARNHDQAKPVIAADAAAPRWRRGWPPARTVALVFGRERNGLENDEVALADRIVTLPVNPAFASLNLAQAVVIVAYEWFKRVRGGELPFAMPEKSPPARQAAARRLLCRSRARTGEGRILPAAGKARHHEHQPAQHLPRACSRRSRTSARCTASSWRSRKAAKGPARGGVLDGEEAQAAARVASPSMARRGAGRARPVRGLARLLRRNPTEAERMLWQALINDRRFAGRGFKRQVPIGPHIADFVSFPLSCVIDLVPDEESAEARPRARRNARV